MSLPMDDIRPGMKLICVCGPTRETVAENGGVAVVVKREDKSFQRDILEVLAVQPPFMVARRLTENTDWRSMVDLRDYQFSEATQEMIAALTERAK